MTDFNKMIATWNEFLQEYPAAADLEEFDLLKEIAVIVKDGDEWCVEGEGGRRMGCYPSKKQAQERLAQIEMFKHMKGMNEEEKASSEECFCEACQSYFFSPYCPNATCPHCGNTDVETVRGED